jgi:hypothetical protein
VNSSDTANAAANAAADEAAAAVADLLVLYGLAGAVIGKLGRMPDGREIADDILALGKVEYGIDIYLEPWPDGDGAAGMLEAWRDGDMCHRWPTGGCSASPDGYCLGGRDDGGCFG